MLPMSAEALRAAEEKMRANGQDPEAVRAFANAYERLEGGEAAVIPSDSLEPASDVPSLEQLPSDAVDVDALGRVAVIKLNGGLATTMGLRGPKSLMEARDGLSFLDVIVGQTVALRERYGIQLPLLLMDSEATQRETLAALAAHPELGDDGGLQPDFLQSMIPKLDAATLAPVEWPREPSLEWCPPGHGDVYGALRRSGTLHALLEREIEYAMISNADNLGSTLDPRIAAHVVSSEVPFLMEVVQGTEADRKGGHVARRRSDGHLVLRESAQTPDEDAESFRDFRRWRYYNTNSLWVSLRALEERLDASAGVLELPLIVNRKTVDPRDSSSTPVLQLESAMGAAIGLFDGAALLRVPRTRFAPVKTTDDLLVLRSDVYRMGDGMAVEPVREQMPYVALDSRYYKLMDDFEQRFPDGPPSLIDADRFVVDGDVTFGAGVVVHGAVTVSAEDGPTTVAAGTALEGP
jgi:UTP--glucose-1-phosphate uridylyltransferase